MVSFEKLVPLYQQVVYCERNDIRGAFVECGVWKGGCVGLMALANLRHGAEHRALHLFDSFCGIPEPDEDKDGAAAVAFARGAGAGTKGALKAIPDQYGGVGTLEINRDLLASLGYPAEKLHFHEGWFQDTVPRDAIGIGPIAILRLDGDWYDSTKICLDHLVKSVVAGGFVIIDDYGAYDGCRRAVDEFLAALPRRPYLHHLDRWGRYWHVTNDL